MSSKNYNYELINKYLKKMTHRKPKTTKITLSFTSLISSVFTIIISSALIVVIVITSS